MKLMPVRMLWDMLVIIEMSSFLSFQDGICSHSDALLCTYKFRFPFPLCPILTLTAGHGGCPSGSVHIEALSGMYVAGMGLVSAEIHVDGNAVVHQDNCERGINAVRISGRTGQVRDRLTFDTFAVSGKTFLDFIQRIPSEDVVAIATYDDAFFSLGRSGKSALRLLGSSRADALNYRGNMVLVGRRGLWGAYGESMEPAVHGDEWGWGVRVNISVCVELGVVHLSETLQRETARSALCRLQQRDAFAKKEDSYELCSFSNVRL